MNDAWPWQLELERFRGERKGQVVGYALVDRADHEVLEGHRWYFSHGYAVQAGTYPGLKLHRLLMGLPDGDPRWVDHINRDRLDNRRENLRIVTPAGNAQNRPAFGRSPYRGVSWHPAGSWHAVAMIAGTSHKLGHYLDERIAAVAAEAFRRDHMPLAPQTRALEPFESTISTGVLRCSRCGTQARIRGGRYWLAMGDDLLCEPCNGYKRPKRGPKFQPPRTCSNCGRKNMHSKLGRCDTCYSFFRRNGSDRQIN